MYKKVLCPVDFSASSLNAIEFAANITKILGSELLLINVQSVLQSDLTSAGVGTISLLNDRLAKSRSKLEEITAEAIKTEYDIRCDYEVDVSFSDFQEILNTKCDKETLIVIGTNGADELYQFFFGSNSYRLLKKTEAPTLIIPENYSYRKFDKVVYAMTYEKENKEALPIVKDIAGLLNANIDILHVSKKRTEVSKEVFKSLDTIIEDLFKETASFHFEQVFSDDAVEAINNYMEKQANTLLIVYAKELNLFEKIVDKKIIREICDLALFPMLVIHEQKK